MFEFQKLERDKKEAKGVLRELFYAEGLGDDELVGMLKTRAMTLLEKFENKESFIQGVRQDFNEERRAAIRARNGL